MQINMSVLVDESGPVTKEQIIGAMIATLEEAYELFCDGNDFTIGSDEWTWDVCYRFLREEIKAQFQEHFTRPTPHAGDLRSAHPVQAWPTLEGETNSGESPSTRANA